jgi:SRSO17 transposase
MDDEARASEARFVEYIESLAQVLGYVDRAGPLKDYCTGLLMPGERKSVEPIASVVAPSCVSVTRRSVQNRTARREHLPNDGPSQILVAIGVDFERGF